jgi:hypothetical protein
MIKDAYGNSRFFGLYRGVVITATPEGVLTLKVPQVLANQVTGPALPVGNVVGLLPEVNEGVWVLFEGGDPSYPLWIGKFRPDTVSSTAPITPPPYTVPKDEEFVVDGGTTGTPPTFTGDPRFTGTYVRSGDLVHFQIQVDMDNITGFGTGQYYLDLPFPSKHNYKFRDGCLHDISASKDYAIGGHVAAGASRMYLFSTDTQSGHVFDIEFDYNSPVTLDTADNFHIAGTYITQDE